MSYGKGLWGPTAELVTKGLNLKGKTILITGFNSGLGKETARVLTLRNAQVIGTSKTLALAKDVANSLGPSIVPMECELTNADSIRRCVAELKKQDVRLDAIIANAGVMAPPTCELVHGIEKQFFVNHIGHFILISNLLDALTDSGRVVIVSSDLHKSAPRGGGIELDNLQCSKNYNPLQSYAVSKFANVAFARSLSRRFERTNQKAFAVHPGVIRTNLLRHQNAAVRSMFSVFGRFFFKSVEQGAASSCFAAVHPGASAPNTGYLIDCREAPIHPDANSEVIQDRLWELSQDIATNV